MRITPRSTNPMPLHVALARCGQGQAEDRDAASEIVAIQILAARARLIELQPWRTPDLEDAAQDRFLRWFEQDAAAKRTNPPQTEDGAQRFISSHIRLRALRPNRSSKELLLSEAAFTVASDSASALLASRRDLEDERIEALDRSRTVSRAKAAPSSGRRPA